MIEQTDSRWLIVEPVPVASERLEAVLPELARRYQIDPYTARQRLIGRGSALVAKGPEQVLAGAAAVLAEHGFAVRVILPTPPPFSPRRLLGVSISQQTIIFHCERQKVTLEPDETVVGVLADLSDHLVEKSLKRLLMQNAYRGADHIVPLAASDIIQAILRGAPIFDVYILRPDGSVRAAVRVFPGRFDPSGLGEKATLSTVGNLEAVIETVRTRAGRFVLDTDFGLAQLPGCRPRKAEDGGDNQRENLLRLTRYGWLRVALHREQPAVCAFAAPPLSRPATASQTSATGPGAAAAGLPAPPEKVEGAGPFPSVRVALLGTLLGSLIGLLLLGKEQILVPSLTFIVATGAFPALLAGGCFAGGIHFLRLKRQIENTPTSRIRSLAMGMVEVRGRAERLYAVVSPMTQMACVYYRLRCYRRERNGWRLTSTDSSGDIPFALRDDTGRITVDPRGAAVRPRTRQEGTPGGSTLFASAHRGDGDEKWVEEVIAEGTPLYVLGFARFRRIPGISLRERTLAILRHYKGDPGAMRRFDADGDGHISVEEWEAARSAAEEEALAASLIEKKRQEQVVLGCPRARSLPFIIAETPSEARLTHNFSLFSAPLLACGVLLAVGAAVLFLHHFQGLVAR